MMKKTLVIVLGLLFFFLLGKTSPVRATTLEPSWETNGVVRAAVRSSNTVFIGGNFTYVGPRTGSFGLFDTSTQNLNTSMPYVEGYVYATVADGLGGWFIGGSFTSVGGIPRSNLAHIKSDMTVDPSWNPQTNESVFDLLVSGGTVYVGGKFTSIGGQPRNRIAALSAIDGSVNLNWDPDPNNEVHALAISGDGATIYAGGWFTTFKQGSVTRNRIAAIPTSSDIPTSWNPDANDSVETITVNGSTVYVGGYFTTFKQATVVRNRIAAITTSDDTPTSWNPNADYAVFSVAVSGDGATVYAGGWFLNIGGAARMKVAALGAATGAADPNFNAGTLNNSVGTMAIIGSKLYIGGGFTTVGGQQRHNLAELDATTGGVTTWSLSAGSGVISLAVNGNTLAVGGDFKSVGGQPRNYIAAIAVSSGTPTPWNPGANNFVYTLAVSSDGTKVYAGGKFTTIGVGSPTRLKIAALNETDGTATNWNPSVVGGLQEVHTIALSADNTRAYVGGDFTSIGGQSRTNLAELYTSIDTNNATSWNPGADYVVRSVVLSGSTLYAGGDFLHIGSQTPKPWRARIAALNLSDGTATSWDPGASDGIVYALAIDSDATTVYVGGTFTRIGSQAPEPTRKYIAAINTTNGAATSWNPNANNHVYTLALNRTLVYAGGIFTSVGGATRNAVAELKISDGLATSWDASVGGDYTAIHALALNGTTLYVGGQFKTLLGQPSNGFGILGGGTVLPSPILDRDAWETNGTVNAITKSASTIYIGGQFTVVGPKTGGFGLLSSSASSLLFGSPAVNGTIYAILPDGSGGWYIGGSFTKVGDVARNNVAHIKSDMTVDPDWDANVNGTVNAIAVYGANVYLGGAFTQVNNGAAARNNLASVNSISGLVTGWNPAPNGTVYAIAISTSGTIYVGGDFSQLGTDAALRPYIGAVDSETGHSTPFDPYNTSGTVRTLAINGSIIYAGGSFTYIGRQQRNYIAALDATTGNAIENWNPDASGGSPTVVNALRLSPDNLKLYVGGNFGTIGGSAPGARAYLAALNTSDGLITSWNPTPNNKVYSLALNSTGSIIYAGGEFSSVGSVSRPYIAAIDASTGAATSWNPAVGQPATYALAMSGTTVAAGGTFTSIGGEFRKNIAAIDASTGAATSWNPGNGAGADNVVYALTLNPSGTTLYVGGAFLTIANAGRLRIAALNVSDGAATTWNPGADNNVLTLLVDSSNVYVGGEFLNIGTKARNRIAAIPIGSSRATTWNPNANAAVRAMVFHTPTTIYVGGSFLSIGGQLRDRLAELNTTNNNATGWEYTGQSLTRVNALAYDGSAVYAGGHLQSLGVDGFLVAINPGTGSQIWNANPNYGVTALAVSGSKIFAGGLFTLIGSQAERPTRNYIAELNVSDGTATSWDANANNFVLALASNGSTAIAGGTFTTMGGQTTKGFAILQ